MAHHEPRQGASRDVAQLAAGQQALRLAQHRTEKEPFKVSCLAPRALVRCSQDPAKSNRSSGRNPPLAPTFERQFRRKRPWATWTIIVGPRFGKGQMASSKSK